MLWDYLVDTFAEHSFLFIFLATALVWLSMRYAMPSAERKPPGPWSLPIIGNIFLFGSAPHKNVTRLMQHYGKVFSMRLGSREVIILNDINTVKEALLQKGSDFSSRPPLHSFIFSSRGERTVAWPVFGPKYIKNKRATELAMRTIIDNDSQFSSTVIKETNSLIQSFLNSGEKRFDPAYMLKHLACSLQFCLFFGEKLRDSYVKKAQFMMDGSTDFIENSAVGNSVDFMPWMQVVFRKQVKELEDSVGELSDFVKKIYLIRKKESKKSDIQETTFNGALAQVVQNKEALSFGNEHLENADPDNSSNNFDDERLVNIIADCFGGGYEKLSTALRWAVAYLVSHRDVQSELQKEITRVKGSAPLTLQDKDSLPLLEATILEILRMSSFLPFALPHCTTRDTSVAGYPLPKGSIVFVNLWGCSRDPDYYEKPHEFNPYRFMDENRQNIVRSPCFLAFSAGDRKCPGEVYAKSVLFLVLGTLLQKLTLRNGTEDPIEDTFGLTVRPKPYKIHAQAVY